MWVFCLAIKNGCLQSSSHNPIRWCLNRSFFFVTNFDNNRTKLLTSPLRLSACLRLNNCKSLPPALPCSLLMMSFWHSSPSSVWTVGPACHRSHSLRVRSQTTADNIFFSFSLFFPFFSAQNYATAKRRYYEYALIRLTFGGQIM